MCYHLSLTIRISKSSVVTRRNEPFGHNPRLASVIGMDVHQETGNAKLNLSLRVVGKRADGFHLIESLMAAIDWSDTITFRRISGSRLELSVPGFPRLESPENLVCRAAALFFDTVDIPQDERGLSIELRKTIPIGSGLGGGSSNAAATLRALQQLYGVSLDAKGLIHLARSLGADVPFFLDSMPKFVGGIGDILGDPVSLPDLAVVISEVPSFLSTQEVYESFDLFCQPSKETKGAHPKRLSETDVSLLLENDLEPAALRRNPSLAGLKEAIRSDEALGTSMTGSGPTFFTVFSTMTQARAFAQRLGDRLPARICRFVPGISEVAP